MPLARRGLLAPLARLLRAGLRPALSSSGMAARWLAPSTAFAPATGSSSLSSSLLLPSSLRYMSTNPSSSSFSSSSSSSSSPSMDLGAEMSAADLEARLREMNFEGDDDLQVDVHDEHARPGATAAVRPDIAVPKNTEVRKGETVKHAFQTETRQILDIVTNSLYTDKEVFVRELISNASDALEKARYLKNKDDLLDDSTPLEARVFTDEEAKTITIQDTGIGMTQEELISNLGTIARSGSKQWAKQVRGDTGSGGDAAANIIGQFGVGFYSAFMVGHKIEVYTRSAKRPAEAGGAPSPGYYWVSDGTGAYEMCEAEGVERGTKIVIHLKEEARKFATKYAIEGIVKKYSNFVAFPIHLNGARVNTIRAIWTMDKGEVSEDEHLDFYRYFANAYDTPTFRMQFATDAPIQINALFYFPERHMEKYGMGRMEPGVSLYSRKVLITPKAKGLLPDYLRFVKGVVDSEDVPLNISRENMQDTALIARISSVLTRRIIRFLQEEDKRDSDKYLQWYREFGSFIKEGITSDYSHKGELARLLRFESSAAAAGTLVSLDDYVSRMPPTQQDIYYLCTPNRALGLASPYYEQLKASGAEVLFLYHPLDDFVMQSLREYGRRKVVSAEKGEAGKETQASKEELTRKHQPLVDYVKSVLGERVISVTATRRLDKYPAVVVDHESAAIRKMMKSMDPHLFEESPVGKQKLEINAEHPVFARLLQTRDAQPALAKLVVEQVFDNALLAADILDNPRTMIPRIVDLLASALGAPASGSAPRPAEAVVEPVVEPVAPPVDKA